ncbi:hypothetical protein D0439_20775 [Lysinibacillus fusiformis]|jgi:hypothetical protein|uniref:hypothetical protein n=1 Tax=Lysinibacillus TaxID=400634 RepID=UPI0004D884FB|nr:MULTISPECIES: hypothetical protein [Lysinibacillus]AJK89606.1 hypothetical protein HR49_21865 [Lysinibacillus fusiformis]KAB0441091.1 hypothetical protein CH314_21095 [Lysinibacillus fusiformis]KEK11763.1 hypothetical protein EP18_10040 [Lysinibacillus sphaericus]KGA84833.1 hypothetical protein KQ41_01460 [Lysinibacillus fusiformis]KHK54258.1 hypothetical protein PI85_05475 [Lysinibacillus sp. A1]
MSYINKHLARTLEQQHKRSVRGLFLKIEELNAACTQLRKRLEPETDIAVYKYAIDYVNQFVAHTSILNLKFITNTQNLEVLVLHALLLSYILENEDNQSFAYEEKLLKGYLQDTFTLNDHAKTLFINHREKMLSFIENEGT